jgi:hypothetical protein
MDGPSEGHPQQGSQGPPQQDSIYDTEAHANCNASNSDPQHLLDVRIAEIIKKGYIDPTTGQPHQMSFQPAGRHICKMLEDSDIDERKYTRVQLKKTQSLPINESIFDHYQERFVRQYLAFHYPNKELENFNNTKKIRREFYFLK